MFGVDPRDPKWLSEMARRVELLKQQHRLITELRENQWQISDQYRLVFRLNQPPPDEAQQILDKNRALHDRNRQIHDELDELFRQI